MHRLMKLGRGAALSALVLSASLPASSVLAQDSGQTCKVTVDRSQDAGVLDVTRQELGDGSCVCYIYTGPAGQEAAVEDQISTMQNSKSCPNPNRVQELANSSGGEGPGTSSGSSTTGALILLGAAGAATAAVALADGDGDDGSDSP